MSPEAMLLETHQLEAGYGSRGDKPVIIAGPLSVSIRAGQLICLLGPNGSGKSTLLRTLAGLQPSLGGTIGMGEGIEMKGTNNRGRDNDAVVRPPGPAHRLSPAQLSKKISLVLTDPVRYSNLTVYSLVALGRYPYS